MPAQHTFHQHSVLHCAEIPTAKPTVELNNSVALQVTLQGPQATTNDNHYWLLKQPYSKPSQIPTANEGSTCLKI